MTFWNVFDPTNSSLRWPHYPLIQATFKDDSELTFKMLWQQWFGGFKGRTKCHPYLKPLARLRNIWRRAYSRPRTGTCRRRPASAWTQTVLHPPRGFCPVKRREGKWPIIVRNVKVASLATLNNCCIWLWSTVAVAQIIVRWTENRPSLSKYAAKTIFAGGHIWNSFGCRQTLLGQIQSLPL